MELEPCDSTKAAFAESTLYLLYQRKLKALLYEQAALSRDLVLYQQKIKKLLYLKEKALEDILQKGLISLSSTDECEGLEEESSSDEVSLFFKGIEDEHIETFPKHYKKAHKTKPLEKSSKNSKSCKAKFCRSFAVLRSPYCRRHTPLDPDSGQIYCVYVDSRTGRRCRQVIHLSQATQLCHHHRKNEVLRT
ncbi:uncharacterized protein LOC135146274 isoform X2 [Zophobas morio]|uniref:uncharacterized protein LOC135146274 isoform X2 n=1 Tax=Zophobas morio TaxID=2755281 RepID=UPI003082CE68